MSRAEPEQQGDHAEAFNFDATELFRGANVSGAELYNNAPAIVTFVTPTCAVCQSEGPELAAAAEANPDITYVFVHGGADQQSYEQYAEDSDLFQENVVHLDDTDAALLQRFSVLSYPTTLLVGNDGTVQKSTGALELQGQASAAELVLGGGA